MKKIEITKLIADDGMLLTNGSQFVHAVLIQDGQKEEDWQEISQKEYAKIQARMTPREFILALLEMGITREQIEEVANSSSKVWAELNYATTILRINPLLDQLCEQFGLTSSDIDAIFNL